MDNNSNVENTVETVDNTATEIDYKALYEQSAESVKELTAERNSLKKENDELRAAKDQAIADGAKAREMNYTLSRQLDISHETNKTPEQYLAEMFLPNKGD